MYGSPSCSIIPFVHEIHNDKREDPYHWLREKKNPKVIKFLEQENQYTDSIYKDSGMDELTDTCYKEFLSRIKETDSSAPYKHSSYLYYHRTVEGLNYQIFCRKPIVSADLNDDGSYQVGDEQILLDVNEIAKDFDYCSVGTLIPSPDHKMAAYTLDTEGDEKYSLHILDVSSPTSTTVVHTNLLQDITESVEWSGDGKSLYYARMDSCLRPYQLYRHELGGNAENDSIVFEEPDERFHLSFHKSQDSRFIFITVDSQITSEVYFIPSDQPDQTPCVFLNRRDGVEYDVEIHGNSLLLTTNMKDQKNFTVLHTTLPSIDSYQSSEPFISDPYDDLAGWKTLIPHKKDVMITSVVPFKNFLCVRQRHGGLPRFQIIPISESGDFQVDDSHFIAFPEKAYASNYSDNEEFDTDFVRVSYSSYLTPKTIYDYNMRTKELILRKQKEVQGNYDPSKYVIERIHAEAEDGTKIPISLVRKKDLSQNGTSKCLLSGYGSYGVSYDPSFSEEIFSLLDRNFVYAIAHVRGGGENGRYWYEDGKLLSKKNTFSDFIACAKHLIDTKYTSPANQAIYGASAGGLLIAAVLNSTGNKLCSVAVASVPFVDVVTTMLDETMPLTTIEWEEWGNPKDETYYEYMKSYSPYDNIKPQEYPHILLRAGLNDSRVHYSEPAKFCAKLRTMKTGDNLVLLKTNTEAGHFGASGRYEYLKEDAYEYAFIINQLDSKQAKE